jgi:hypothetical protein
MDFASSTRPARLVPYCLRQACGVQTAITIAWVDSEEFNFKKQLLSHIMQRLGNPSTLTIVRRSNYDNNQYTKADAGVERPISTAQHRMLLMCVVTNERV